ncbi:MAG: hypothetical protein ACRD1V_06535 [Vicinamibacterales bacterium]
MMRRLWIAVVCSAAIGGAPLLAAGQAGSPSPELQKLDVSVGRWVFHGQMNSRSGQPASFTWNEDCQWSPNHLFLECTFSNNWNGKAAESLVVDSYNTVDKSYWHYEMFSTGGRGSSPFVSRMDINGNTWVEHGRDVVPGKTTGERITYTWESPTRVTVVIETSKDGVTWAAVDRAEGAKQ